MKPNVTTNRPPVRTPAAPAPDIAPAPDVDRDALAAVVKRLDALTDGDALERVPSDVIEEVESIAHAVEDVIAGCEPHGEEETE